MKRVTPEPNWPDSWKYSYTYDLLEIYGETNHQGYAYAYANRRRHILELIQKVAKPGAKVLDVAAGQGNFSLMLAELGYEVTWNDFREDLIDYVKLKREYGTINYVPGNVFSVSFDFDFDVVLIAEIIEHVAHPNEFLNKIAQMVKPGGYIIMSTPNGEYFQNRLPKFSECQDPSVFESMQFQPDADGHIFLLHLDEVKLIAQQANLSILETRLFNNTLTNGYLKSRNLFKVMPHNWINVCEKFTNQLPVILQRKVHSSMAVLLLNLND
ncbi:class I SAM-dependent methyltransferase [Halotia branconii]|uniref:Methyltransferase domain-containing protein n=1 Tax=Halotia branconii CENA392 TaxID=1539056 RepID=A0AAJ6NPL9_9CYAN|nr:methyltransferase domain-containing protein [Halotia branconii]WGV24078.1 methyltransferase domain-containing protein [Halotia branconii CENA392]